MPTILCIFGTSRPGNYTSRALAVVRDELRERRAETHFVDARELDLPFPGHPSSLPDRSVAIVLASPWISTL